MKTIVFGTILALGMTGGAAFAAVVGGGVTGSVGAFVELDPTSSFSVGRDNFQTRNLYAFDEDQNIILPSDIFVDYGPSPIVAGTVVASHYVFHDPGPYVRQTGYVDFDAPILGVATSTGFLAASDFLINNNVTYLNPTLRGLESVDSVSFTSGQPNRLYVDFFSGTPGDYVRVFTAQSPSGPTPRDPDPVPLPAGGLLLLTAIVGLGRFGRKFRA